MAKVIKFPTKKEKSLQEQQMVLAEELAVLEEELRIALEELDALNEDIIVLTNAYNEVLTKLKALILEEE